MQYVENRYCATLTNKCLQLQLQNVTIHGMSTRGQYIPTTFYLEPILVRRLALLAIATGKPKTEIVREILTDGVEKFETKGSKSAKSLLDLAALGEKLGVHGPGDLSTNLDHYLYDE